MKHIYFLIIVVLVSVETFAQTQTADSTEIYMDSLYRDLPEVMITGERPIVKAAQGKLIYDLPRIIQDRPVDNAYEVIKELPGVTETDGKFSLLGRSVHVVIDGKVSSMTVDQLNSLLKSIPSSRLEKAEVMIAAPARYQLRGPMINICLKGRQGEEPSLQGEFYTGYFQKHNESLTERASLQFSSHKFSADFLYSYDRGRSYNLTDKEAKHTLSDGSVYPVDLHEVHHRSYNEHSVRLGADYDFAKNHQLSMAYYGEFTNIHSLSSVEGIQTSDTRSRSTDQLHNGRMDYRTPFGLRAGTEFTFYSSPSWQLLHSKMEGEQLDFLVRDRQRINKWRFYVSQEHELSGGWGINYGASYTMALDNSYQYYYDPETEALLPVNNNMKSSRNEHTLNFFAGFSKSFGKKLSLDLSLATEQYHTSVWNEWSFYPTMSLNYTPLSGHIFQLTFSSDKGYPNYWSTQDASSYLGGAYSVILGNPLLKPDIQYHASLTYILKNKYMFTVYYKYQKDWFTQTLYQRPDRLEEVYKYLNFDYYRQAGLQVSVPFKIKKWLNSRWTVVGVHDRQKNSQFWDIPFDRKVDWVFISMNNTFTFSSKPDLKLTLSGNVRTKAMQGIYDLPASGTVNAALRYTFAKDKAILMLRCNDIFETGGISPRIHFDTQNVTNHYSCYREFAVSFTYKFGGYKEKERNSVDTSRFK